MKTSLSLADPSIRPATLGALARRTLVSLACLAWAPQLMAQAQSAPAEAQPAGSEAVASEPVLNSTISAPLFYQLLLGELNVTEGEPGTGFSLILDAARKQKDPQLYRRAVDIALQSRSGDAALTAANAWAEAIPDSPDANRFVLQILLALNRVAETGPALRALIERSELAEQSDVINAIPLTFARVPDKAQALKVVREVLAPALKKPALAAAAWTTIGRMELAQDLLPQALASARNGLQADPTSVYPALLALELMERGQKEAETLVQAQLKTSPPDAKGAPMVALAYARILLDLQRNAEARAQLETLRLQHPELPEPWLLLATLQVQDNKLPEASEALQKYMALARQSSDERVQRGLTQAYLLMAQVAEKQKDFAAASAWLDRIENAEDIMAAQMRRASLLARQGQMAQARALLRGQRENRPDDARLKFVAEAQLLRDFKQWQTAFDVYGEAVLRFPGDSDLIYDQAMVAEKLDRLDEMERLLRQIMESKPDQYQAYNALGYSLADRGLRLPEAKQLIEKAVALAPNDAYIQDSLGWVEFRMGNAARALEILRAAYGKRPDAEIAAHLGEVLWSLGQAEPARNIWREGLMLASDNEVLLATLQRLKVNP